MLSGKLKLPSHLHSHSPHRAESLIPSPVFLIPTTPDLLKHVTTPSVLMSKHAVRPALQKLLHVTATRCLRHLPSLRSWLSRHCQVCLILSCLTRCYLEPRLSGPLNPFVTHNNKKLRRRSLSGDWEEDCWTSGEVGWEEGACSQVHGNSGELPTVFFFLFSEENRIIAAVEEELRTKSHHPLLFWQCLWPFVINLGAIFHKFSITMVTAASKWRFGRRLWGTGVCFVTWRGKKLKELVLTDLYSASQMPAKIKE